MDVKNCKECGRLFNYMSGEQLCPSCKDKLEDKFQEVKTYIRDNAHAGVDQVATDCEVSVKQIKKWIREERLTFTEDSPIMIECESCGAPIRSGKYCDACRNKMQSGLESMIRKPQANAQKEKRLRDGEKMRFLDK